MISPIYIAVIALLAIHATAFTLHQLGASRQTSLKSRFLSMATTMQPVPPQTPPKVPPPVPLEVRTKRQMIVPTVSELNNAVRRSRRTESSKDFCMKSGGYPDKDVKEGVYLLVWSMLTKNLELEELKRAKSAAEKEGRIADAMRYADDLSTFGLI